jgi:hypothetical protein
LNSFPAVAAALALFSSSASATTVFSTDFSSATQESLNAPIAMGGTLAAGYSVTNLAHGDNSMKFILRTEGTDGNEGQQQFYDQGDIASFLPGSVEVATLDAAITNNSYYEFTLSNESAFSLRTIGFSLVQFGYKNATGRESVAYVFTDLTSNFSGTVNASESLGSIVRAGGAPQGVSSVSIALSGITALEDITSVTFRVYWTEGFEEEWGNRRLGIDDLSVAVVPEPSAYALLGGVLAFGFTAFRRRK